MALPPRAPAAASESSEAKLSSVAARDLMAAFAYTAAGGSSSGSGTSSWTTYTSSRDSALSSEPGLLLLCIDDEEKAKRLERVIRLVKEFCNGDGDDITAVDRWLSEMGVGWVLDLADDPSAGKTSLLRAQCNLALAERWIRALIEITEYTHLEYLHLAVEGHFVRGTDVMLRFVDATIRKMLPFVDALLAAAADVDASTDAADVTIGGLQALLSVRDALTRAPEGIHLCFSPAEMDGQLSRLLSLLSEKEHRLQEAIWNTMEAARIGILNDNNEWGIQISQGSPDICKVTRSLVTYIKYLWDDYSRLDDIVRAAAKLGSYVPNRDMINWFHFSAQQVKTDLFTKLALEMVSSLEVKLAQRSESFPYHSLRFIFLINNTHFIQQHLHPLFCMRYRIAILTSKIEGYVQEYLLLSWAPVMSCLYNHTPRWFRKNSALAKFDLEFEKTYTAQKLWKVPDPMLRIRLRKAIINEVIPDLTGYLEANNITSPPVSPQERKEMLLELFEG